MAEIGGGYGRLAYVIANLSPARYVFFDIPPTLAVAQWYFTETFGSDAVAAFARHQRQADMMRHIEGRRFVFCTPNQIELFPAGSFSLAINIDSLSEMQRASALNYLAQMRRISRAIYLRNLRPGALSTYEGISWSVPHYTDYATPPGWERHLERAWPVDRRYLELIDIKR